MAADGPSLLFVLIMVARSQIPFANSTSASRLAKSLAQIIDNLVNLISDQSG